MKKKTWEDGLGVGSWEDQGQGNVIKYILPLAPNKVTSSVKSATQRRKPFNYDSIRSLSICVKCNFR